MGCVNHTRNCVNLSHQYFLKTNKQKPMRMHSYNIHNKETVVSGVVNMLNKKLDQKISDQRHAN